MKNLLTYYLFILLPIPFIIYESRYNDSNVFIISILTYTIIYRPVIDGLRLYSKGVFKISDFWKLFVPFYRFKIFKTLYTNS
jgi:hypothetical protein